MNNKIIVLQGIPGSGKSTWARSYIKEKGSDKVVIVNRDSIRSSLGDYWVQKREPLVTELEKAMIEISLDFGYDVIIDATNLNPHTIRKWKMLADEYNASIEFKGFPISLRKALWRDFWRGIRGGRSVGKNTIRYFYNRYKDFEYDEI